MRTRQQIEAELAKAQGHVNTMHRIMSNCHSDEAFRGYSRSLNEFIADTIRLERELEELKHRGELQCDL